MKNLRELAYVVNQNKVKRIDLLDPNKHRSSKVNRFYRALCKEEIKNDEEAFTLLYPDAKSRSAYNNLKAYLRDKLINTLFFIDAHHDNHSDRQACYFESHKEYAAAQILLAKNAYESAVAVFEKLLKRCEYFEFTELCLLTCQALCLHYSTRVGSERYYQMYNKQRIHYEKLLQLEGKAERHYSELILAYVNNKSPKPHLSELAEVYYGSLQAHTAIYHSYKLHLYATLIQFFQHTCLNEYPATLPICMQAITFFRAKPYMAVTPIQLCQHHQLVAYLQLGDHTQAARVAIESQQLTQEGTFNWFNNLEYLYLLAMQTERFQDAYIYYHTATAHQRFNFLPEYVKEMWEIYRAYLHLMIDLGKVQPKENDGNFTPFRIQRFLNSIPIYSKDKSGMNIAILIIQVLFYVQKKQYDKIIDRMEAIQAYCKRYLLKPETVRSYYFLKLLLAMPDAGFHPSAIRRHTASDWKKLEAATTAFSQQFHKIEIIPYEWLWELMLKMMNENQNNRILRSGS